MNILLINPPKHSKYFSAGGTEPLGLESIAAMVRGDEVSIVDFRFEKRTLKEVLKTIKPDIVGVTGYTVDVYNVKRILFETKLFNRKIITLVGGAHASVVPEDFNETYVDVVVPGLGEHAFLEVIEAIKTGHSLRDIKGIGLPSMGGMHFTEKRNLTNLLNELPFPRRDLTKKYHKYYNYLGFEVGLIATARGCPFRCNFCSIPVIMGGKYFTRSAENVFAELKSIPQKYIRFADGNTFGNIKRMEELYWLIKNSGLDKKFIFDIRSDFIVANPDLIKKYKSIGFEVAAVGLESIDNSKLDAFNKQSSRHIHEEAIRILHDLKIKIVGQFVIDQNFSSVDFEKLKDFVLKYKIHFPSYSILTPFPGTKIFEDVKHQLISENYEYFDLFHSVIETKVSRKDFFKYYANLYLQSYSIKRIFINLIDYMINIFDKKRTYAKDISFFMIILIKINILTRLRRIKGAYQLNT